MWVRLTHVDTQYMKEKLLAHINQIKQLFSERKKNMPPVRFHKPYIEEIQQDVETLEQAFETIQQLDEAEKKSFAPYTMFHLMEKVVPVFRHWMARIQTLQNSGHSDIAGHKKAKQEYDEQKVTIYTLVAELNALNGEALISIDSTVENPGREIIKQYKKDDYLLKHVIQTVEINHEKVEEKRLTATK
ncbi:hypothetical protein [Candidatus Berkiella aquae]|uniref:Uncharacterized protein n=1 Tax=Candidatus Berkiella aquae TaxID=295108 RepID=A0A0Q9YVZ3_9GAMM|nr:hypothetical protein [Candidatus Berkiella aquae]MCS5711618.1 hypothetical protein [Candidatus Berkiella aquae]